MHLKKLLLGCALLAAFFSNDVNAQAGYWQQAADYEMFIDFDVTKHQYTGDQTITYTNNSPDTLNRVFYHLYFNAFQPNSMMDVRSRTIADADPRVADRIQGLKPNEIGYIEVDEFMADGQAARYSIEGTIMEVDLPTPILPGQTVMLKMKFRGQVPLQIRRSGRDNAEGISYSMAQWYPKLSEYDYQGWHANPYVGREFHGVWGDFDVKIRIDQKYLVAASGYIQNAGSIPAGSYNDQDLAEDPADGMVTYHFNAPNVHDFLWAADPDYTHVNYEREDGTLLQFFYQKGEDTEAWEQLPAIMDKAFAYINKTYGQYPYKKYAFIQGGDGGMEYPMATLIRGERNITSLVGVSVHELMHSWYQMVLGTNESLYAWMDEGFTSYASSDVMNHLRSEGLIPGDPVADPHQQDRNGFLNFIQSGLEEPLSIHSDHFKTNAAYGVGSYVKGSLVLYQLQYILGQETFGPALRRYYNDWKFKHPNPNDFIRVMEKESGLELDWFKEYFVYTTRLPDYGITSVDSRKRQTVVNLENFGDMPMPIDLVIEMTNGDMMYYTIPLRIMRGAKTSDGDINYQVTADWPWTNPTYQLELDIPTKKIAKISIDPSGRMLDTDDDNNVWENND